MTAVIIITAAFGLFVAMLAGNLFMRRAFKVKAKTHVVNADKANEITWDSGCPRMHNTTSKGIDITDRLLELGADELPENCRYGFFKKIEIQNPRPEFDILSDTYSDVIAVIYKEEGEKPHIALGSVNPLASNREQEILNAAQDALDKFMEKFSNHLARKQFEEFLVSPPVENNPDLTRLGDRTDWVEDN